MAQVSEILGGQVEASAVALREDIVRPSIDRAAVLREAPEADHRFFKVPKVIER
jgi:aspartyl-tRNA(Asn)/glutamyl-tRNA(Gln) amidotransferase subunit C